MTCCTRIVERIEARAERLGSTGEQPAQTSRSQSTISHTPMSPTVDVVRGSSGQHNLLADNEVL